MLKINTIIRFRYEVDNIYRVLWLNKKIDLLYIINVNEKYMPVPIILSELKKLIEDGEVVIEENDNWININTEDDISVLHKKYRDKAWSVIEELVKQEPYIFETISRRKLILEVSETQQVSESTIKRNLKRFWSRGKIKNALTPDYNNSGAPGKEKVNANKKRGRPRKNVSLVGEGINIDENIKKIFKASVNKYYNTSNKNSLITAYNLMIKEYFTEYKNKSIIEVSSNIPSIGQFKYWFYKNRNYKKEISSRYGSKRYDQRHRELLGNTSMDTLGPGDLVQIDSTIADLYLVSEYDRSLIIGRPTIYLIIDAYSYQILGVNVTLESASHIGAAVAIYSMVQDKVELCKQYGIDITKDEWPVCNLPNAILADRGEMEGKQIESLIENLGISIRLTSSYRAEMKAKVEKAFDLINQNTKPFITGKVDGDFRERGDKDFRLKASLTLKEYTRIVIKTIIYHNNHHVLKDYSRSKEQIEDNVKPIPIELWNWGIENMSGCLKSLPQEVVILNLMPTQNGTITSRGLKFKGVYYSSKKMMDERWFEKARNSGTWKVKISYDPRNINNIYIKNSNGREFDKCFLLDHQDRYKDKTLEDISYLMEMEKLDNELLKQNELQAKLTLMQDIESIVKESKDNYKHTSVSNRKRLIGIDENRKFEKELNRKKDFFELNMDDDKFDEAININEDVEFNNHVTDELELLKKKQKRGFAKINE